LGIDQKAHSGDVHNLVVKPLGGIFKRGTDIPILEIGIVLEDLLTRRARSQQIKDIRHPDPEPADARATTALLGVNGDTL
jgi:hypothetical protein